VELDVVVTDGNRRLRLEALAPGEYELRLVVTDRVAPPTTATRSLRFTVE
jgi:hypothetical protein